MYLELLELYNKHSKTDVKTIKKNLRRLFKKHNVSKEDIQQSLNLTSNTAYGLINISNKSKPSVEMLLKVCVFLNERFEETLKEDEKLEEPKFTFLKWTDSKIKEYVIDYAKLGKKLTAEKYGLQEYTAEVYYNKYKNTVVDAE